MAYSDFTLKEVTNRFQLHIEEKPDVFSEVPEGERPVAEPVASLCALGPGHSY